LQDLRPERSSSPIAEPRRNGALRLHFHAISMALAECSESRQKAPYRRTDSATQMMNELDNFRAATVFCGCEAREHSRILFKGLRKNI